MKKSLVLVLSVLLLGICLISCDLFEIFNPPILLSKKEHWLKELTAENVVQIKTIHNGKGVTDGLEQIVTVKNSDDIAKIIESYQNVYITPQNPRVSCYYPVPMYFSIEFTLSSGEVKKIVTQNGTIYNKYFITPPKAYGYDSSNIEYRIHPSLVYWASYFSDGTYISYIADINHWQFEEVEYTPQGDPKYLIELDEGTYYKDYKITAYDEYHFYLQDKWYKLTNANFDDMFGGCYKLKLAQDAKLGYGKESRVDVLYGIYNNVLVCNVNDVEPGNSEKWEEEVLDYSFKYYSLDERILVFYDDEIYTLVEAYEKGLLTEENLADIYNLHRSLFYSRY